MADAADATSYYPLSMTCHARAHAYSPKWKGASAAPATPQELLSWLLVRRTKSDRASLRPLMKSYRVQRQGRRDFGALVCATNFASPVGPQFPTPNRVASFRWVIS